MAILLAFISITSLPLGLWATRQFVPRRGPTSAVHAVTAYNLRTTLLAEVVLTLAGAVAKVAWHVPLALTVLPLLMFNLLILLPLRAYAWEAKPHYTKEPAINVFAFGLLAAVLAYANYVLYFARQSLSARYVSTNNPFYFKATAVALATLFLCQGLNLLLARASHHERFFTNHLWKNQKLVIGFGISLLVLLVAVYTPPLNRWLKLDNLSIGDWLWALVATGIYLGFRLLQRHTRKHSRQAVIALHHQKHHKQT